MHNTRMTKHRTILQSWFTMRTDDYHLLPLFTSSANVKVQYRRAVKSDVMWWIPYCIPGSSVALRRVRLHHMNICSGAGAPGLLRATRRRRGVCVIQWYEWDIVETLHRLSCKFELVMCILYYTYLLHYSVYQSVMCGGAAMYTWMYHCKIKLTVYLSISLCMDSLVFFT
jgi:hypothetical protein